MTNTPATIFFDVNETLSDLSPVGDAFEAVDAVIAAFSNVSLHSDVAPGIRALHDAGHRLFTLSNGPASNAERMLTEAGVADAMAGFLSVEDNSPWKPARASYEDALTRTATSGVAHLVAVHPWDIHGAAEAGLSTAWVNRQGARYPAHFTAPTVTAETLEQLHTHLA